MLKKLSAFFVLSLLAIILTQPAFAGGGPVDLYAFSLQPFDQTHAFIVAAETYNTDCSHVNVSAVSFTDSENSDSVTPFTPPDDGTYLQRHMSDGNGISTWLDSVCTTYTKVVSGAPRQRVVSATVTINGTPYQRSVVLSFGDDQYSKQIQSFGRRNNYDNISYPDVYDQTYIGNNQREVKVQWNKISWADQYAIFTSIVTQTETSPVFLKATESTKTTLTLPATSNIKIIVMPCRVDEPCVASVLKSDMYGFFHLNMMINPTNTNAQTSNTTVQATSKPTIAPVSNPTSDDLKMEELNKKVASLEGKLAESEKKQSVLEQRIGDLVSFIKRLFPFFQ